LNVRLKERNSTEGGLAFLAKLSANLATAGFGIQLMTAKSMESMEANLKVIGRGDLAICFKRQLLALQYSMNNMPGLPSYVPWPMARPDRYEYECVHFWETTSEQTIASLKLRIGMLVINKATPYQQTLFLAVYVTLGDLHHQLCKLEPTKESATAGISYYERITALSSQDGILVEEDFMGRATYELAWLHDKSCISDSS
jgi:hypothetical protein